MFYDSCLKRTSQFFPPGIHIIHDLMLYVISKYNFAYLISVDLCLKNYYVTVDDILVFNIFR